MAAPGAVTTVFVPDELHGPCCRPGHGRICTFPATGRAMSSERPRSICVDQHPAAADVAFVREQLTEFNRSKAGNSGNREFGVFARDGDGKIIGGLIARQLYQWMYITDLYVADAQRRAGIGSELLCMAEQEAVRLGCHSAYLCTFGWQARPFYERFGYVVFGELDQWPLNEKRYFMRKRLLAGRA